MEMEYQEIAFKLILSAGNAKSLALQAIASARENSIEEAYKKLQEADNELQQVHSLQFKLIQKEAAGEQNEISVLLIHAQDHFMDALLIKDMAKELILMYERINK